MVIPLPSDITIIPDILKDYYSQLLLENGISQYDWSKEHNQEYKQKKQYRYGIEKANDINYEFYYYISFLYIKCIFNNERRS